MEVFELVEKEESNEVRHLSTVIRAHGDVKYIEESNTCPHLNFIPHYDVLP